MFYRTLILFLLVTTSAWSQHPRGTAYHARRATDKITIDGILNEKSWQSARVESGFFMSKPYDSVPPVNQTAFRITFDDTFLYLAFECEDDGEDPVVQSLRRDFEFRFNDNVGFYFDPYNDYTNGFYFNITPYGVQREGLMANGGADPEDYSAFWDNKWYSAVTREPGKWTAELAIPFKSIRYNRGEWNFNILRNDLERNQVSSWIATPVQYLPASFAWSGKLIWDDELPKAGTNISFIPYVASSFSKDNQRLTPTSSDLLAGFDAKVGVTPSLNLDLTFNPDFSQVEVDRQVINLTRFEFQFPELRQFFLENSDLFAQPGFPDSRPFFSRRIGLAFDSSGFLQRVPILYGARLSGKMGKDWRVGLLNIHTRKKSELGLPDQNYTMAIVQRQILERSNVDFFVVNKQSFGLGQYNPAVYYQPGLVREIINGSDTTYRFNHYNRVAGFDFNINSKNNQFRGDIYYHRSFDEFNSENTYSAGTFLGYFGRRLSLMGGVQLLGENFNAEAGFVPNLTVYPGFTGAFMRSEYLTYPKSKVVANYGPYVELNAGWIPSGLRTDEIAELGYSVDFLNTSSVMLYTSYTYQYLTFDFNPIGGPAYQSGDEFTWKQIQLEYQSDNRKLFNYNLQTGYGGFYTGRRLNASGEINYRYQPYGSISARFAYEDIDLGEAYGKRRLFLLGPRLDVTFTNKIFLTTFIQYNNLLDNINLNARFQWRFQPASDFFIVYTENYLPSPFGSKNRALVLKLTYWLNI
ncbi:MAG: carbohydrate binding family 9 domain-containing protein [Cyclobacteriaceae bacterium]|nr:carbohydrate binding family 9 domain-containing protein [Cyclobacteriaceae bacterium]